MPRLQASFDCPQERVAAFARIVEHYQFGDNAKYWKACVTALENAYREGKRIASPLELLSLPPEKESDLPTPEAP